MSTISYYIIVIDTNKYAGNFERELCAYLTSQFGECSVGSEIATDEEKNIAHLNWWNENIRQVEDEHGTNRPVEIQQNSNHVYNSLGIFVNIIPPADVMEELKQRLKHAEANVMSFIRHSSKEYENFKVEGIRLLKHEETIREVQVEETIQEVYMEDIKI